MTLWTLILRSLRHHARTHLGVLLGATIGSAVLIGALLVGDSVRVSLREMALARLGKVELAAATGDRLVRNQLALDLSARSMSVAFDSVQGGTNQVPVPIIAPVLQLHATLSKGDGSARANRVQVLGVDHRFSLFTDGGTSNRHGAKEFVGINLRLAEQLSVKAGDSVVVRLSKLTSLSKDAPLAPQDQTTVGLRLTVTEVVDDGGLGRFSLQANQVATFNLFLPLATLQRHMEITNRANLLLAGVVHHFTLPKPSASAKRRSPWEVIKDFALLNKPVKPWKLPSGSSTARQRLLPQDFRIRESWALADAELDLRELPATGEVELRTSRVFLDDTVVRVATNAFPGARPIATYFVNELRVGERATPYSMVTALGAPVVPADMRDDETLINQWLADDLGAKPGDSLAMTYYVVGVARKLEERTNTFRIRAVVPMSLPYSDRELMPEFPGLAKATNCRDWDAGFPINYDKMRQKDQSYWDDHKGTPKAFVTLAAGEKMWSNRFGTHTAVRFNAERGMRNAESPTAQPAIGNLKSEIEKSLLSKLDPATFGLVFQPVREQALKAAEQSQDFGGLFIGFSFFLIVAALVLMAMLFQFGVEQRAVEVGTLLALGFTPRQVRRMLLLEGAALAFVGGVLGAVGGAWYARAMLHALSTVWRDAVGTTALRFHATPQTVVIGVCSAVVVAVFTVWLALRKQVRQPARVLLAGGGEEVFSVQCSVFSAVAGKVGASSVETRVLPHPGPLPLGEGESSAASGASAAVSREASHRSKADGDGVDSARPSGLPLPAGEGRGEGERPRSTRAKRITATWLALGSLFAALALVGWAVASGQTANAGAFFGAGALLLIAGLAFLSALLSRLERSEAAAKLSLAGMGVRNATRRRKRSLATATMLACGSFLIVSIGAFRLDENANATKRASGTGGFAFLGESTLPVIHDLNSKAGREFFTLDEKAMAGVSVVPFRVRDGDDASCLNLNRAQKPRLLGVHVAALEQRQAFAFSRAWSGLPRPLGWYLLASGDEAITLWHTVPKAGEYDSPSQVAPFPRPHPGVATIIPGIADEASILWALGKKLGDTIDFTDERGRPFKVRLVAALANSILQGSLVIDEAEFIARFPIEAGYRMFLVDAPTNRAAEVSATLTRALRDVGLELTPTTRRLAQLNAVQNTYLSTFQVLGGLGLLLGSVGLGVVVLRNVLERRGELALLLAVGFRPGALRSLVVSEHGALLLLGLGCGVVAAAVAVAPAVLSPNAPMPYGSLALTLGAVLASGAVWTWLATVFALRGRLLDALRSE